MERFGQWLLEIPPVTRYWTLAIAASSLATTTKLIKAINLVFLPDKAFGFQYWRLITSFCYFGDLSLEWVLNIWLLVRSSRLIEESYSTSLALFPSIIDTLNPNQTEALMRSIERNKSIDYSYYITLICISIVGTATYAHYNLGISFITLGPLLEEILLYVWCRNNPEVVVNIFGVINVRTVYFPLLNALISWVLSREFYEVIQLISTGNIPLIMTIFTHPFFRKTIICFALGHIWWFTREFLLKFVYFDSQEDRRSTKNKVFQQYHVSRPNIMKAVLIVLILPPWYWVKLYRLRQMT